MYFDIAPFWFYCLTVAPLIGAVVLFGVHLSTLRKHRLESQKLVLEIQNLKKVQEVADRRIVIATTEETKEYNDVCFYRGRTDDASFSASDGTKWTLPKLSLLDCGVMFVATVVIMYFLYDLYRLGFWLWLMFK
jgi:hypothetical protein